MSIDKKENLSKNVVSRIDAYQNKHMEYVEEIQQQMLLKETRENDHEFKV